MMGGKADGIYLVVADMGSMGGSEISPRDGVYRLGYLTRCLGNFSPGYAGIHSHIYELGLDD